MKLELVTLFALFGVALFAGFIDVIAGGDGLLTEPALLATGMSPALVLGTNKLQSSFGVGALAPLPADGLCLLLLLAAGERCRDLPSPKPRAVCAAGRGGPGSKVLLKKGVKLSKPLLVIVSLLMSAKLVWS